MLDHMNVKTEVIGTALEHFIPSDDFPRATQQETKTIQEAKASRALRNAISNGAIASMLGNGQNIKGVGFVCKLSRPISFVSIASITQYSSKKTFRGFRQAYRFPITEICFAAKRGEEIDLDKPMVFWPKHSLEHVCTPWLEKSVVGTVVSPKCSWGPPAYQAVDVSDETLRDAQVALNSFSLFELCGMVAGHMKDLPSVLQELDIPANAYDPEPSGKKGKAVPFRAYASGNSLLTAMGKSEVSPAEYEELINAILFDHAREIPVDASIEAAGDSAYKAVFSFRNEKSKVVMSLIKTFDWESQTKLLIPVTMHAEPHCPKLQQMTVPLPEIQILFNLDKIVANPETLIILTDSVEIAGRNQARCRSSDVVWASFICDSGCYNQVDWMPLVGRKVCLLVTNHSGQSLAEKYVEAKALADYLKGQGINLTFAQVEVDFPHRQPPFTGIADYRHWYLGDGEPRIVPESIKVMDRYEFGVMAEKAAAALQPRPFWADAEVRQPAAKDTIIERAMSNDKPEAVPYLIRPVISQRGLTFLCASKGTGKSALATSLCASIISGKPVFEDVHWTVPTGVRGKTKILYLDLEMDPGLLSDRMRDFFRPYLAPDRAEQDVRELFKIESLLDKPVDFTKQEWQDYVLMKMKELEAQGDPNIPVGLVVFDTFVRMGPSSPGSWAKMMPMIQAIQSKGAGVLILAHLNRDGEVRGFQEKEFAATEILLMKRDEDEKATLATPITMIPQDLRLSKIEADRVQFNFKLENGEWAVEQPLNDPLVLFGHIVTGYQDKKYPRDAICEMMGMGHTAYSDKLKKAKLLLKSHPLVKTKAEKEKLEAAKAKEAEAAKKAAAVKAKASKKKPESSDSV